MSARTECYKLCSRIMDGAFSNLAYAKGESSSDNAFAHILADRVFANKMLLEHILKKYVKKPPEKLDREVYLTLLIGLCELRYFNTPENIVVNDSVKMIRSLKKSSAAGMVNAVLRSFIRDKKQVPPVKGSARERFSVENSIPMELLCGVADDYGDEKAFQWGRNVNACGVNTRYNPLRAENAKLFEGLADDNAVLMEWMRSVSDGDDFRKAGFAKGLWHYQGISSQLCSLALDAKPGDTVIDVCAAPGGKSFTVSEEMGNEGRVISCDKTQKRVDLIVQGAKRLGIDIIETAVNDATVYNDKFPTADRVLCDVPCSGYGVIHSKPEIRYKPLSQFAELPGIQYRILETSSRYVRPGGTLVYSTCTVRKCENEDIITRFLENNPDFYGFEDIFENRAQITELSEVKDLWTYPVIGKAHVLKIMDGSFMRTIFENGCDGFFIAVMKRK